MYSTKLKYAFTLAEVLITLLIIGVVASLIIPNLLQDTQNEELNIQFKKDFGIFSDAARRMMLDNGGNLAGFFLNNMDMMNKCGDYIILTKKCPAYATGCFYAGTNTWKNLHGDDGWIDQTDYPTAIMNNGSLIKFSVNNSACTTNNGTGSPVEYTCGDITIDINGFKGPNQAGRDMFYIWVTKTGIYPFGIQNDNYSNQSSYCSTNSSLSNSGKGCAAKVLKGEKIE